MMPNIDHKINILQKTNKTVVDPTPKIIAKAYTGSTSQYFTQSDVHALVEVQPAKIVPRVILPYNSTMDP